MTNDVLIAVLAVCIGVAVGVLAMLRRKPSQRDDTEALDALNAVNAVNAQLHAELTRRFAPTRSLAPSPAATLLYPVKYFAARDCAPAPNTLAAALLPSSFRNKDFASFFSCSDTSA